MAEFQPDRQEWRRHTRRCDIQYSRDLPRSVTYDPNDLGGELDFFVADITPPLSALADGQIASVALKADSTPNSTRSGVRFSKDPVASFGNTQGQSVPGQTIDGGNGMLFLPVVGRLSTQEASAGNISAQSPANAAQGKDTSADLPNGQKLFLPMIKR